MKKALLALLTVTTLLASATAFAGQNIHQTRTQTQQSHELGIDCTGGC